MLPCVCSVIDYRGRQNVATTWNLFVKYIISSVMHALWLVLTYDLLEDRRIDDLIIKTFALCFFFKWRYFTRLGERRFGIKLLCKPWTVTLNRRKKEKPFSLLFFFSVRVCQSGAIWIFFPYSLILSYIKQMDSMLPCSGIDHRGRQNVVRTSVTYSAARGVFWRHLWSITEQTHGNIDLLSRTTNT